MEKGLYMYLIYSPSASRFDVLYVQRCCTADLGCL